TAAVFTGSGFKLLWRLDEPTSDKDEVESVNRALVQIFDGDDGTTDVSRLLRLPGTLNHPGERKRRKYGRTDPVLAEVIYFELSRRCPLTAVHTAARVAGDDYEYIEPGSRVTRNEVKERARDRKLRRRLIDKTQDHEDRSDAVWAVAKDLREWLPEVRVG